MTRFLTAAFLATSAVAFAQNNPCATPLTGTSVPVVITYTQPVQISASPIPSVPSIASGAAQLVSATQPNFGATVPATVTLPTPATIQSIPVQALAASPSILSAQIASPSTLNTVLSQVPAGALASIIYADTSIGSAAALGNGINIVAAPPGVGSPLAKLQSSAGAPVITGFSPSSTQGSCALYQISGAGFGSTIPPTVMLAGFNALCDTQSPVGLPHIIQGSVGIEGDPYETTCPSEGGYGAIFWYWYETEIPATVINATDSLITIGIPQSLAGVPSIGIVVTNNADNLTGRFCSIESGNDPCVVSPTAYDPSTNNITFQSLPYVNF